MTNDNDDIEEFLEHALMEETRAYLERGRALADIGKDELFDLWAAMVRRWFYDRSEVNQSDMDDAAAEIRLRGLDMPENKLGSLIDEITEENRRDPRGLNKKTHQQYQDYLAARKRPH